MPKDLKALKQSQDAKQVNLAEWRASRLHEMDLPSGLHVKLRDVDMTDILLTAKLPDSILVMAEEAAATKDSIDLKNMAMDLMKSNGPAFKQLMDALSKASLVEPQIGDAPDDTHITIDELIFTDKMAIMDFINREVEQIKPFREGENEPVAAIQHGDGVRVTAITDHDTRN